MLPAMTTSVMMPMAKEPPETNMTRPAVFLVCLTVIIVCGFTSAGVEKTEQKAIQGTWQVDSAIYNGKPSRATGEKKIWAIDKSHVCYDFDTCDEYKLNPMKQPKWIEVIVAREGEKTRQFHGIYKLEGDSLQICLGPGDKKRPETFQSTTGSGCIGSARRGVLPSRG
jgi:uncharacterized protein (TIGR03067 family)